jgi:uncharacterized protein (TIGR02453 family)
MNRDVRFSNDKSPYKTYISAFMSREPGVMSPGLVYLQLDPNELFVGAGFYVFETPSLLAGFRHAIAGNPKAWQRLTDRLNTAGHSLERDDTLKRVPKGFEPHAGSPIEPDLKLKSFVCKLHLTPDDLSQPDLADQITAFAKHATELLNFGWTHLSEGTIATDQ